MGAAPETYFTIWDSLFECLNLKKEDTLLIRGAKCASGYVSIQTARASGCKVIVTKYKKEKLKLLIGAVYNFMDIKEVCITLDSGKINGKIVVEVKDE